MNRPLSTFLIVQVGLFLEAGVMALAAVAWSVCGRGWSIETIEGGGFIVIGHFQLILF